MSRTDIPAGISPPDSVVARLRAAGGALTDAMAELQAAEHVAGDPVDAGAIKALLLEVHALARRCGRIATQAAHARPGPESTGRILERMHGELFGGKDG